MLQQMSELSVELVEMTAASTGLGGGWARGGLVKLMAAAVWFDWRRQVCDDRRSGRDR
jgi:hypothetical protein